MSEVQRYVDRLVTQKIETHDFEDGGDGKCTHPIYQTTCGYPMNHIIHGYKALPADWHEDSSLETWFPLTAEELKRVKAERDEQAGVIMADTAHIESLTASLAKAEAELSAARETIARLSAELEEATNKLRAHDGLVALKNGIPETTGDAEFDEVLRLYPVAEMIQRNWLGSATDFSDLPFLRKQLLKFFDATELGQLLDPDHWKKQFSLTVQQDKGEGKDGK